MAHQPNSVSVIQAMQASALRSLIQQAAESQKRLETILPLCPPTFRQALKPGPIDGTQWCILVANQAVGAKLRQMLPHLVEHLQRQGWQVNAIRIKIQSRQ